MKRGQILAAALLVLTTGAVAGALIVTADSAPSDNERLCALEALHPEIPEYDECQTPTSTTSTPPTSSTTVPSTTSTTFAPTTTTSPTTTIPPTTTTTPTGLVIPPTQPYPPGLNDAGGYKIIASCADQADDPRTPEDETIVCPRQDGNALWWEAVYLGKNLPYLDGVSWYEGDGDREGYACAYGFGGPENVLLDEDTVIGSFAFVRPFGQAYGKVNDAYMEEGQRYYSGAIANEGGQEISEDCRAAVLSHIDYDDPALCAGPDQRPRIGFFTETGQIWDIRDYSNTVLHNPGHFTLIDFDGETAIVGFCSAQTGKIGVVVYYQSRNTGQIAVDFNGTGPYA